jgi:hypothetical protein
MKFFLRFILTMSFAVMATANADTILWDESVDGDLTGGYGITPTTLIAVGGANTVIGRLDYINSEEAPFCDEFGCIYLWHGASDDDALWLDLPDGAQITDITLAFTFDFRVLPHFHGRLS